MKIFIILGNGFTIDFINHFSANIFDVREKMDVVNLFRLGDRVNFPYENRGGFLSHKRCPSLWMLGARPNNSAQEAITIIEEIITCANMFSDFVNAKEGSAKAKIQGEFKENIYLKAYRELVSYLVCLFSYYNSLIGDNFLKKFVKKKQWGWIKFFYKLKNIKEDTEIVFVTYNYDIWLERILRVMGIMFSVYGFGDTPSKICIIKPHGSISFVSKHVMQSEYVNSDILFDPIDFSQLKLSYEKLIDNMAGTIIPPAGDSLRLQSGGWSDKLRQEAKDQASKISPGDEVILCGMSYWHVDRRELDSILVKLSQDVNFAFVNPHPPRELNAVLVSIFRNYTLYTSSQNIEGIIDGRYF